MYQRMLDRRHYFTLVRCLLFWTFLGHFLIFRTSLWEVQGRCGHSHFVDGETESIRDSLTSCSLWAPQQSIQQVGSPIPGRQTTHKLLTLPWETSRPSPFDANVTLEGSWEMGPLGKWLTFWHKECGKWGEASWTCGGSMWVGMALAKEAFPGSCPGEEGVPSS